MVRHQTSIRLYEKSRVDALMHLADADGDSEQTTAIQRLLDLVGSEKCRNIQHYHDVTPLEALEMGLEEIDVPMAAAKYDPTAPAEKYDLSQEEILEILEYYDDPEINQYHVNENKITWPNATEDKVKILAAMERYESRDTNRAADRGRIETIVSNNLGSSRYYLNSGTNFADYPGQVYDFFQARYNFDEVKTTEEALYDDIVSGFDRWADQVRKAEKEAMNDDITVEEAKKLKNKVEKNMSWIREWTKKVPDHRLTEDEIDELIERVDFVVESIEQEDEESDAAGPLSDATTA